MIDAMSNDCYGQHSCCNKCECRRCANRLICWNCNDCTQEKGRKSAIGFTGRRNWKPDCKMFKEEGTVAMYCSVCNAKNDLQPCVVARKKYYLCQKCWDYLADLRDKSCLNFMYFSGKNYCMLMKVVIPEPERRYCGRFQIWEECSAV